MRVVAQVGALDLHAREALGALGDVRQHRLRHVGLDADRGVRDEHERAHDLAVDLLRRLADGGAEHAVALLERAASRSADSGSGRRACPSAGRRGRRPPCPIRRRPRAPCRAAWPDRARRRRPGGCARYSSPLRSTILPRGAWMRSSRTRLTRASARYLSPDSTCRYQRRKKTIANSASATPPKIATRSASCGVIGVRRSPVGLHHHRRISAPRDSGLSPPVV